MTATITINEIEQRADRAFAYALLARSAKSYVMCIYRLREVGRALDTLIGAIRPEHVARLAHDESDSGVRLRSRLTELHHLLVEFAGSEEAAKLNDFPLPIIPGLVQSIQDRTEDLGDIVENLALSRSDDLRNLVSCCAASLNLEAPEDLVGGMHDQTGS
jgi:hypothetical protein